MTGGGVGGSYLVIETERMRLYLPPPEHAALALDYVNRNRAHFEPWIPRPPEGFYTEAFWRERLAHNRATAESGRFFRMFARLVDEDAPRLIAASNLNNIVRGAFQAGTLGYSMDGDLTGRGLMTEALRGLIDHAFGPLGLHRVMANYIPHNVASGRVLRKLGFTVEGYARDYLEIDGVWQDHVLTALTRPDS